MESAADKAIPLARHGPVHSLHSPHALDCTPNGSGDRVDRSQKLRRQDQRLHTILGSISPRPRLVGSGAWLAQRPVLVPGKHP